MMEAEEEHIRDLATFHARRYANEAEPIEQQLSDIVHAHDIEMEPVYLPDCPEFRGVAYSRGEFRIVVYNTAQPIEIQNHYIAHELAHLLLEHLNGWLPNQETAADLYATALNTALSVNRVSNHRLKERPATYALG